MSAGAALSAIAGVGGSLFNTLYSMYRNNITDERDDTAIQRRVKDLQAAGLNPLLAAGNGANTTLGMSTNLDTSGIGNFAQTMYDLKNQRESYKQNQLYTKLMENELQASNWDMLYNNIYNQELFNLKNGRFKFGFDKLGNMKTNQILWTGIENQPNLNGYVGNLRKYLRNQIDSEFNQGQFNLSQSLFNLKTQGYRNGLELTKDTLQPLLDLGSLMTPTANFLNAIRGRRSFNYNQNQGNYNFNSYSENHNYNYKRR